MGSVVTVSTGGADWHYSATAERVVTVECVYRNHRSLPYISPERNLAAWLEEVGGRRRNWFRSGCLRCLTRLSFPAGACLR